MEARVFNSADEVDKALNEVGLYRTKVPTLYIHQRLPDPFRVEVNQDMTPRERGIVVEETIQALRAELDALRS